MAGNRRAPGLAQAARSPKRVKRLRPLSARAFPLVVLFQAQRRNEATYPCAFCLRALLFSHARLGILCVRLLRLRQAPPVHWWTGLLKAAVALAFAANMT